MFLYCLPEILVYFVGYLSAAFVQFVYVIFVMIIALPLGF